MSDEFLRVARQEIQLELSKLERIVLQCNNDEQVFENAQDIKGSLHKIRGLAPMIGQETVGEIAKITDNMLRYIIDMGTLLDSYRVIAKSIDDMKRIFADSDFYDISSFKKLVRDRFPHVPDL